MRADHRNSIEYVHRTWILLRGDSLLSFCECYTPRPLFTQARPMSRPSRCCHSYHQKPCWSKNIFQQTGKKAFLMSSQNAPIQSAIYQHIISVKTWLKQEERHYEYKKSTEYESEMLLLCNPPPHMVVSKQEREKSLKRVFTASSRPQAWPRSSRHPQEPCASCQRPSSWPCAGRRSSP